MISENRIRQIIKESFLNLLLERSPAKSNKEEFLQKAHTRYGNLYVSAQVGEYIDNKPIVCPINLISSF